METILSLDQSISSSGVCIFKKEELIHFECIKTSKKFGTDVERISHITNSIMSLYSAHNCDHIICESLSFGSFGNATRTLGGLLFTLEVKFFEKYGLTEIKKVAPTQLKKFATSNGKAKKTDMLDAVPDAIVEDFISAGYLKSKGLYDLCDAYHIGKWLIQEK